jgi:competence protein ComEC
MEWMFLKNNPFIRVLLPFIGGIILGYQFSCNLWLVSAVIVVILLFLFLWSVFIKTYSFRWVFGIFVFIALVLFGVVSLQLVKSQSGIFSGKSYKGRFEAIVEEVPVKRNDNYSTNLLIKKILVDSTWHKFNFEVKAIFKSDSLIEKLKAGQTIEFESIINNKAQGRNLLTLIISRI